MFLLLVGSSLFGCGRGFHEELPIDLGASVPEELRWQREPLLEERNAYPALLELGRDLQELPADRKDLLREHSWRREQEEGKLLPQMSPELAVSLLGQTEPFARRMDEALSRGAFQFPTTEVEQWWDDSVSPLDEGVEAVPFLRAANSLRHLRAARARALSVLGKHDEAVQEIESLLTLGDLLQAGKGLLIGFLLGTGTSTAGLLAIEETIRRHNLPEDLLIRLIEAVPEPELTDKSLVTTHLVEFNEFLLPSLERMTVDQILLAISSPWSGVDPPEPPAAWIPKKNPNLLDRHETLRLASLKYRRWIENARVPWWQREQAVHPDLQQAIDDLPTLPKEVEDFDRPPTWLEKRRYRSALGRVHNPVGKLLMSVEPIIDVEANSLWFRTHQSATRAIIAIAIFQKLNGALPEGLQDLVRAGILSESPRDPATGKPLLYDSERKLIWGAGADGEDNGGDGKPGVSWIGRDIVFSVPVPGK